MMGRMTAQRRSLCTWTGMAVGFRAFFAVIVDGGQLYGSAWLSILGGLLSAVPVAAALIAIRRLNPHETAENALEMAAGRWGKRLIGLIFFFTLAYDAGAVISLMTSTARYVAMPEANRNLIRAVTAAAGTVAALMGAAASANAAVLWKKLAAALIVILILTQAKFMNPSWLTPVLGPGMEEIFKSAAPAAGMFAFAAAGWLMMESEHDQGGTAMLKTVVYSGLVAAAMALLLSMLISGILEEPPTRSFRIGRLLANDRAGLTLEMPYVVLIYGGMLTMLVFELTAAARSVQMTLPGLKTPFCVFAAAVLALGASLAGWAERGTLTAISMWYYPLIALPVCLTGLAACIRGRSKRGGGGE